MKRKKIKSSWTEYFNFSSRERKGSIFLACILIIQIGVLLYQRNLENDIPLPDKQIIEALLTAIENEIADSVKERKIITSPENEIPLFNFDPNILQDSLWLKLGLSIRQIKVINNYLSHGGKFRIKNDFKKMFCISEAEYLRLESYLLLPDSFVFQIKPKPKEHSVQFVNINQSDSTEWMSLKGIGPVLAARIVNFREKLGGFYSPEQIREVWGITDSLFLSIQSFLIPVSDTPFRFIHLNTDTFSVLAAHPYIKGKIAGLICNYRKQHKFISDTQELKLLPLITEENFRKLAPYLMLD